MLLGVGSFGAKVCTRKGLLNLTKDSSKLDIIKPNLFKCYKKNNVFKIQ